MIQKPDTDTILDEIHETRRQIAKKFNYDIAAIVADARQRQTASGRPIWRGKPLENEKGADAEAKRDS